VFANIVSVLRPDVVVLVNSYLLYTSCHGFSSLIYYLSTAHISKYNDAYTNADTLIRTCRTNTAVGI
jgi:hypothetical protein